MSYEEAVGDVAKAIEAVGAAILVVGGLGAFAQFARRVPQCKDEAYTELRRSLGRVILLGLEVLIIGDIVRTIVVDLTLESAAALGIIVVIRILLSFSLQVEIDGTWPWDRRRRGSGPGPADPNT
jgi:uncharacterized membrane protein